MHQYGSIFTQKLKLALISVVRFVPFVEAGISLDREKKQWKPAQKSKEEKWNS